MANIFKKIAFHLNGRPRKWFRNIFFDADLKVKPLFRSVVYDPHGFVRPSFDPWYVRVLQNPNGNIDPQWMTERKNIISFNRQRIIRRISIIAPPATFLLLIGCAGICKVVGL